MSAIPGGNRKRPNKQPSRARYKANGLRDVNKKRKLVKHLRAFPKDLQALAAKCRWDKTGVPLYGPARRRA